MTSPSHVGVCVLLLSIWVFCVNSIFFPHCRDLGATTAHYCVTPYLCPLSCTRKLSVTLCLISRYGKQTNNLPYSYTWAKQGQRQLMAHRSLSKAPLISLPCICHQNSKMNHFNSLTFKLKPQLSNKGMIKGTIVMAWLQAGPGSWKYKLSIAECLLATCSKGTPFKTVFKSQGYWTDFIYQRDTCSMLFPWCLRSNSLIFWIYRLLLGQLWSFCY